MVEIKDNCDLTLKIGDTVINPINIEDIKRDSSPRTLTGIMTFDCEELSDSEISMKCEVNLRNGTLKGKYENCTIEGKFDPDSVRWIHV